MTFALQITYRPSAALAARSREETVLYAQAVKQAPGLLGKFWIAEEASGLLGGWHLFQDRASAEAWRDKVAARRAEDGSTEFSAHIFKVDEELSRLTGAAGLVERQSA